MYRPVTTVPGYKPTHAHSDDTFPVLLVVGRLIGGSRLQLLMNPDKATLDKVVLNVFMTSLMMSRFTVCVQRDIISGCQGHYRAQSIEKAQRHPLMTVCFELSSDLKQVE